MLIEIFPEFIRTYFHGERRDNHSDPFRGFDGTFDEFVKEIIRQKKGFRVGDEDVVIRESKRVVMVNGKYYRKQDGAEYMLAKLGVFDEE